MRLNMFEIFFPILILVALATIIALALILLSILFGRRTKEGAKTEPYESGIVPVGDTRSQFPVKFYLVAILFILFDIEVVFLYPWALIYRQLGVFGFIEMLTFIVILLVGYFYILGKGALKWD
ncbi:NADH-quinone oxidoreductase subunit A [Candidatus Zixiibacteriota bacterium]|nr:NADH-quinone oxidoreductase subunit A [candidate division Zixibacteria bacterium]